MSDRAALLPELLHLPRIVRRLVLRACDAFAPGGELAKAVSWVPVQGKGRAGAPTLNPDTNREREMREGRMRDNARVYTYLLRHVDIVTHDVGRGADKTFYGVLVTTMSEELAMEQRTVERVLHDLHAAGLIRSVQRAERKDDGSYRGHTAVRKLSLDHVVALLGLARDWFDAQRTAMRERAALPPSPQQMALKALRERGRAEAAQRGERSVGDILGVLARGGAPPKPTPA